MPYLSHILGKRVLDSAGQPMGVISDLAITIEEPFGGEFPPVTLVLVKAGSAMLRLRWEMIADIHDIEHGNVCLLDQPRARLTIGQEKEGEVYLKRDVLDKQILDVTNARLVRVNDVFLLEDNNQMRAVGVDVSLRGLLRRVKAENFVVKVARRFRFSMPRQHVPWNQVQVMRGESGGKIISRVPAAQLSHLHPSDLAAIVHQMSPAERTELIGQLDDETAALALEEADDEVAADIVQNLDPERAADIIEEMDPDEAADVLGEVDSDEVTAAILHHFEDPEEAADIRQLLTYEEGTAGALMNTDIIGLQTHLTCGETLVKLRADQPTPHNLYYLHLENESERLVGVISLAQVVLAEPDTVLKELIEEELVTVDPESSARECARLIAKYDLISLPVVDVEGCLLGVVTVDDVMDEVSPEEWARRPRVRFQQTTEVD